MPILTEETSLYPETLLDGIDSGSSNRRWWVIYTKARQEKATARGLLAYGIPFYLPLVKKTSLYRGRRISSWIPLFSGYVFLYGSEKESLFILTTNRVSRVLTIRDPHHLQDDLRRLRQLIAADVPLMVESRLVPGTRVRVRHGPLAGFEGTVLTRHGRTRLVVSVDFLQQGTSVEIDDFMVEPIH